MHGAADAGSEVLGDRNPIQPAKVRILEPSQRQLLAPSCLEVIRRLGGDVAAMVVAASDVTKLKTTAARPASAWQGSRTYDSAKRRPARAMAASASTAVNFYRGADGPAADPNATCRLPARSREQTHTTSAPDVSFAARATRTPREMQPAGEAGADWTPAECGSPDLSRTARMSQRCTVRPSGDLGRRARSCLPRR